MDESVVKHLEQPAELSRDAKTLLRAADILERDGWIQNCMHSAHGHCLLGAIECAVEGSVRGYYDGAAHFISRSGILSPHSWNDRSGRTKEEVIAKLRAVALGG